MKTEDMTLYVEGNVDVKKWKKLFPDLDFTDPQVQSTFGGDIPPQRKRRTQKVPPPPPPPSPVSMAIRKDEIFQELIQICGPSLTEEVDKTVKLQCYGCQVDHPSQRQHDLCLMMSFPEKVDRCFGEAYAFWTFRVSEDDSLFQAWRDSSKAKEYTDEEQIWAYTIWKLELSKVRSRGEGSEHYKKDIDYQEVLKEEVKRINKEDRW